MESVAVVGAVAMVWTVGEYIHRRLHWRRERARVKRLVRAERRYKLRVIDGGRR